MLGFGSLRGRRSGGGGIDPRIRELSRIVKALGVTAVFGSFQETIKGFRGVIATVLEIIGRLGLTSVTRRPSFGLPRATVGREAPPAGAGTWV